MYNSLQFHMFPAGSTRHLIPQIRARIQQELEQEKQEQLSQPGRSGTELGAWQMGIFWSSLEAFSSMQCLTIVWAGKIGKEVGSC